MCNPELTFTIQCAKSGEALAAPAAPLQTALYVVTYIPVFAINEDTALSLALCEDSDLIRPFT